jgi:hypothetical protein
MPQTRNPFAALGKIGNFNAHAAKAFYKPPLKIKGDLLVAALNSCYINVFRTIFVDDALVVQVAALKIVGATPVPLTDVKRAIRVSAGADVDVRVKQH